MAQRRMLSKRISQSKRVNNLSLKSQIIYTWTLPWLDDYGCYTGDPEDVKTEVFPKNKRISARDIEGALRQIATAGLIVWYSIDGQLVQQYHNFESFQTFKGDRERKSDYPQYQADNAGMVPIGNQEIPKPSLNLSKVNLSKDKYMDFVFLTKAECDKLVGRFGRKRTIELIESLNTGIGAKGYKYKSHYFAILKWAGSGSCRTCGRKGDYVGTDDTGQKVYRCDKHKAPQKPQQPLLPEELTTGVLKKPKPAEKESVSDKVNKQKQALDAR